MSAHLSFPYKKLVWNFS